MIKKGIYKHYKGNLYEVLGVGKREDNLEDYVIYKALYDIDEFGKGFKKEPIFLRKKNIFEEEVEVNGKKMKRFEFLKEN